MQRAYYCDSKNENKQVDVLPGL